MKRYKFFAHFNRVNMQRGSPRVWTLHFRGMCMQCEHITFNVPVRTDYKQNGRQPRATLRGEASRVFAGDEERNLVVV